MSDNYGIKLLENQRTNLDHRIRHATEEREQAKLTLEQAQADIDALTADRRETEQAIAILRQSLYRQRLGAIPTEEMDEQATGRLIRHPQPYPSTTPKSRTLDQIMADAAGETPDLTRQRTPDMNDPNTEEPRLCPAVYSHGPDTPTRKCLFGVKHLGPHSWQIA